VIAAASQVPAWRDISTAPKDGTVIDLWVIGLVPGRVVNCRWGTPLPASYKFPDQWVAENGLALNKRVTATHWRLPPDPPL